MCGRKSISRWLFSLPWAWLVLAGPATAQGGGPETAPSVPPVSSTNVPSDSEMQAWQNIDDMLTRLISESEVSETELKTLLTTLAGLRVQVPALLSSLEASKRNSANYVRLSDLALSIGETQTAEAEKRAKTAEAEARVWRVVGIVGACIGVAGGTAAWLALSR
jgi:hypothetical protein